MRQSVQIAQNSQPEGSKQASSPQEAKSVLIEPGTSAARGPRTTESIISQGANLLEFEPDLELPALDDGDPQQVWDQFFTEHRPTPVTVQRWIMKLHQQRRHQQVIACLQQALTHGQTQPWMYEVLALSMEIEDYPKEDIERVVLSLSDFGHADYESMLLSAAYLTRFDRKAAALHLYRQASRMLPERSEPYVLGLKLARTAGTPEDLTWAATGILLNCWGLDYQEQQQRAEDALREAIRQQKRAGQEEAAATLQASLQQAQTRDLSVRVTWNGDADVDLEVEEPIGAVCSVESPLTSGGGIHLHDGVGPDPENSFELYVCPLAQSGPYRIRLRLVTGKLVGDRVTLSVISHEGTPEQSRMVQTLTLTGGEGAVTYELDFGRRTTPRVLASIDPERLLQRTLARGSVRRRPAKGTTTREDVEAAQEFADSRNRHLLTPPRAGAFTYAPVVQTIPEGASLSAQAVVSADRRYVRLAIQPTFSTITDVFTFSYLNGN